MINKNEKTNNINNFYYNKFISKKIKIIFTKYKKINI